MNALKFDFSGIVSRTRFRVPQKFLNKSRVYRTKVTNQSRRKPKGEGCE